jgi:carbohydrate kinase (thermoresistant glucokinase family)
MMTEMRFMEHGGDLELVPLVVVMGVSGSGKSTVGDLVAESLGVPFVDGDHLHPMSNISKLREGEPLTDADKWPWLAIVGETLADAEQHGGMVIACSALKRQYRDAIRRAAPHVVFVLLGGSRELLAARLATRPEHLFSPAQAARASQLSWQLAILEPLDEEEHGVSIDVSPPLSVVVDEAVEAVRRSFKPLHALR